MFARFKEKYTTLHILVVLWAFGVMSFSVLILVAVAGFTLWKAEKRHVMYPWQERAILMPKDIHTMTGVETEGIEPDCHVINDLAKFLVSCSFFLPEQNLFVESRIERSTLFTIGQDKWMHMYGQSELLPYFEFQVASMGATDHVLVQEDPSYAPGDENWKWRAQTHERDDLGVLRAYRFGDYTYSIILLGGDIPSKEAWKLVLEDKIELARKELE